jgi:hypothetical protein
MTPADQLGWLMAERRHEYVLYARSIPKCWAEEVDDAIQDACVKFLELAKTRYRDLQAEQVHPVFLHILRHAANHLTRRNAIYNKHRANGFRPSPSQLSQPVAARLRSLGQATHCQRGHLLDHMDARGHRYCHVCRDAHRKQWEAEHRAERTLAQRMRRQRGVM